ncbi:hypothetical protein TSUD_33260 [Trifolium subterraneum]|uniref:Uncharacterized protein n=1 Tax=Trifolium subterraneum TaxID=3900 RepID=A0A2Z6LPM9_TRISU|nr:hypothetical protein TSUD_33260 [Trifolium subterraneum]
MTRPPLKPPDKVLALPVLLHPLGQPSKPPDWHLQRTCLALPQAPRPPRKPPDLPWPPQEVIKSLSYSPFTVFGFPLGNYSIFVSLKRTFRI